MDIASVNTDVNSILEKNPCFHLFYMKIIFENWCLIKHVKTGIPGLAERNLSKEPC